MSRIAGGNLAQHIQLLEGGGPARAPSCTLHQALPGGVSFIQILGMARFWESASAPSIRFWECQEKLFSSLYGAFVPWAYIIVGDVNRISVYLGLPGADRTMQGWIAALASAFPGCESVLGPQPEHVIGLLRRYQFAGSMTGNPSNGSASAETRDGPPSERPLPCIEGIIRAMRNCQWAYVVLSQPTANPVIEQNIQTLAQTERDAISTYCRRGSVEEDNQPLARRYIELLQSARQKYEEGRLHGMWDTQVYLLAHNALDLTFGTQSLISTFAGPYSRPQPVRVRQCIVDGVPDNSMQLTTRLTTREAATVAHLLSEEFPGYRLFERVTFATSPPETEQTKRLAVGIILDDGRPTQNWFEFGLDELCRHALVAGVPGSGKTQTCHYILNQLWEEHRVPWLVLEPSIKSEYRRLIAAPAGKEICIFTAGDETGVPFRLNPMEVQPGVHVQTHIDGLISLFNASFAMVTPMPEVLSLALHRVYEECGWDLARSVASAERADQIQPTLDDLVTTVRNMVDDLGYDAEVTGNLRAALQTRLSNLCVGGKGLLFNSGQSVPMSFLLSRPVIIETAAIGDDETKAFLLGALLLHLAEHLQNAGLSDGRLRHVTLIEEAHRLLTAIPETAAPDVANSRGKAVASFCALLAEVRAFGEGIIVVDQIPTKLASDAIKNTGLKIIHRLVAEDDRRIVGGAMNLSASQERALATLKRGQAVLYAEQREIAYLAKIPNYAEHSGVSKAVLEKRDVVSHMTGKCPLSVKNTSRAPRRQGQMPLLQRRTCPGCGDKSCTLSDEEYRLVCHAVGADLSRPFAAAQRDGWDGIWMFGQAIASTIWGQRFPADAPYCILIHLVIAKGYGLPVVDLFKGKLSHYRTNTSGRSHGKAN